MGYEATVKVDDYGTVQKDSLTALTSEKWGAWVNDQIHEKQRVMFGRDKGDYSTTSIFSDLIPDLERSERFKAYEGIKECLDRAYEDRKSNHEGFEWNNAQLDNLLLLVCGVETRDEGWDCTHQDTYFAERVNTISRFLDVVESRPSFELLGTEHDLYFRVLQALNGVEAKLPYEFWSEELQKSPSVYADVCFSGAANNSPYDGINILSHIDWSTYGETRSRMQNSLMFFYYVHHSDSEVIGTIDRKKEEFPEEVQQIFVEAKEEAAELVEKDKQGEF